MTSRRGEQGRILIRDAESLARVGHIEPSGFTGSLISGYWFDPSIATTPDGRSLVTAANGELTWWDLSSREPIRTLRIAEGYRALALSPDGRTAAVGLDDGLMLLDLTTGASREVRGVLPASPTWLLFAGDGATVVSTGRDGTVTLWDVAGLTPRATMRGHSDAVLQPVLSPDGRTLYTASHDGSAIAWDVTGDRGLGQRFTLSGDEGHTEPYPGRFSPDGRWVAASQAGGGIRLWNVDSGGPAGTSPGQSGLEPSGAALGDPAPAGATLPDTGGQVTSMSFSPDSATLAALADTGTVTIWDVGSLSLRHAPFVVPDAARGVGFSGDGTTLAVAGGAGVVLVDVSSGAQLGSIGDGRRVADLAFSPTEALVAFIREGSEAVGGGDVEIWDVARRSRVRWLDLEREGVLGRALAWSPDGSLLVTAGFDPLVHVWDVRTGRLVRELEHNVGTAVWSLDLSPDGTVLAAAGGGGFVSLWDMSTGAEIGTRLGSGGREAAADVSPDGRRLLVTLSDGTGAIWDIDSASWQSRACALANRSLTREEWDRFLPGRPYEPACLG